MASAPLPEEIRKDLELHVGCVSGTCLVIDLEHILKESGFENIRIKPRDESREFIRQWAPDRHIEYFVLSATIEAIKPE